MPEPILSARGVRKTYRTAAHDVDALRGIDIDINAGELVMVMGPSGNGKTTMLNCLSGLDDIDAGTVFVDGMDLHGVSDARRTAHRARRMGFVFRSFNLFLLSGAAETGSCRCSSWARPAATRASRRSTSSTVSAWGS